MREAPALRIGPEVLERGRPDGPLAGRTFVVKDLIDVRGVATGAGNPTWLAEHAPAISSAPAVSLLIEAGATCIGKAHTDELAYSLAGSNAHYGAPPNPAAPGRLTGGSSSGSASAVAAGVADLALGTDTGGSIRVPASYCGLVGFRPTHGRIDAAGVVPLAPSFDTVGILSRTVATAAAAATTLLRGASERSGAGKVGELSESRGPVPPARVVVLEAAFAVCDPGVSASVDSAAQALAAGWGVPLARSEMAPAVLRDGARAFTVLQSREAWTAHGAWVQRNEASMGAEVAARFRAGAQVTEDAWRSAAQLRARMRIELGELLAGSVLVLPSAPTVAAPREAEGPARAAARRSAILQLTCLAGMIGAPALSLPLAEVDGLPVGVCLIGAPGTDEALLRLPTWGAGPTIGRTRR